MSTAPKNLPTAVAEGFGAGAKKIIRTGFSGMRAAPRIDGDHPAIIGTTSAVHLAPLLFKSLS
jgi:hypothetical protein